MTYPQDRIANLLTRRGVDYKDTVLIAEVGSTAHGMNVNDPDNDDLDLTVVRWEDWAELITGPHDRQSMMIRTQPDGERSRFGDIDLNVYTVRKFAGLMASGNPSILGAVFSPKHHRAVDINFDELARKVASAQAGNAFLGYMRQQIDRWVGARGQKSVTRPELVEQYGFDTKYAAHTIRLGIQGIEYMAKGRFTMPIPEPHVDLIVTLRTGGMDERKALAWAHQLEADLKQAVVDSPLPDKPGAWRQWVNDAYKKHWTGGGS